MVLIKEGYRFFEMRNAFQAGSSFRFKTNEILKRVNGLQFFLEKKNRLLEMAGRNSCGEIYFRKRACKSFTSKKMIIPTREFQTAIEKQIIIV